MGSVEKNDRETGAQKLEPHPEIKRPNPVHTGDRGDEPKKPYGLTESLHDRGPGTRHYDGKAPAETDDRTENSPPSEEKRPL